MTETRPLLLIVAVPADAKLIRKALESCHRYRINLANGLAEARTFISSERPDLVIANPQLDDGSALSLLDQSDGLPLLSLLLLTDDADCATAVDAIKAGAINYLICSPQVLRDLPNTIDDALQQGQKRTAEQVAINYAAHFGRVLASSLTEIYTFDAANLHLIRANRGARKNLGYSKQELHKLTPLDLNPELSAETFLSWLEELRSGRRDALRFETRHRRKDGSLYPVDVHLQYSRTDPPVFVAVILDISSRKQAEERLQVSEARFRSIFNTAAAGLAFLSPEGRILDINPYFSRFTGYSRTELVGRNIEEITHPQDRKKTANYYAALQQDPQQIINIEKRYLHKDGEVRWGHASIACVPGQGNLEPYCIGLVQDITRHKDSEEKMRDAYAELDAFVSTVAHDLRNPLTPIIGMAEFLQQHASEMLDETAMDFLRDIEGSGQRMLALLEDLLVLARVGHVSPPSAPTDVARVLAEVQMNLAAKVLAAGVSIRVANLSPLCMPETLISQLFDNLLGNAVRYAGKPGAIIEVEEEHLDNRLVLVVRDHGPGIPREDRSHIFEAFYRGKSSEGTRGTGIGLATVRKIARLYGGEARFEVTPGGGSTFRVELPHSILSHQEAGRLVC